MNAIIESMNAWGARFAGFALPMLMQSAMLIALLFALDWALRKWVRATIRCAVWMLVLVKLALPPSLALPTGAAYWLPAKTVESRSTPALALVDAPVETFVNTIYSMGGAVQARLTWQAGFFMVWLAVAAGMAIWVVWRLRMVVGVIRQSAEAPETVRVLLESCRRQLGIKRAIPVRCAAIGSPAICGVLRPIILIPPELAESLGGLEMRPVLLHELAHYKRGDLWVNHAQMLLQIVYWYNPLLWLANARIRRAREQAVDEMVLVEMGGEAEVYPAALLHVATLGLGRPPAAIGLMGILEPGRGLTQRILHIMNRPLPRTARIGARGLAAVLLLALLALPMACRHKAPSAPQAALSKPTPPRTISFVGSLTFKISKEGAMTLQDEPVTRDNLQTKLEEAHRKNPDKGLNIQMEPGADMDLGNKVNTAASDANIPFTTMLMLPSGDFGKAETPASHEIKNPAVQKPLVTSVMALKHSNLTNILAELQLMMSPGSGIVYDALGHELIIRTTKNEMPAVKALIAKLDNADAKMPSAPQPAISEHTQPKAGTNESGGDEALDPIVFDSIPLTDAIRALALTAGLNIQIDPKLLYTIGPDGLSIPITPPIVTERWHNVTARQALAALLDNWGWQLVMDPRSKIGRVTIKNPAALEPLVSFVIELKHSNLTDVSAKLQPMLSPRSSVIIDARTHNLIIRTTEREMADVKALIAKLDSAMDETGQESAPPKTTPVSDWSGKQLMHPSGMLDSADADALEAKLARDPEDFSARRDLLAYYGFRDRAAKAKHVLWIIEHHPEFSGNGPEMSLDPVMEGSAYRQGKELWLQNVEDHPTNARILGNAAAYFTIHDHATAEELLTKAQRLEPKNPGWSDRLGQLYKLEAMRQPGTDLAVKALAEFERAQAQTSPAVPGSPRLVDLAKMALAVGDLEKARTYANELLGPGLKWSGGGNAGDAFFQGNIVLGRIALHEGKVDQAEKYLLEAGKTKGSPVLDSFGPNMSLAKELLEKGETNTVLEFFQECGRFWPRYGNEDKLGLWAAAVKAGKPPDFGANLNY